MTNQVIPADAVEAAAKAYRSEFPYDENEGYIIKIILEAAAPHMLAGRGAGLQVRHARQGVLLTQPQPVHAQQRGGEMNITEFLEARIAEDEQRANYYGPLAMGTTRVLAECAAKRAIIAEHAIDLDMRDPYCDTCAEWWKCEVGEGPPMVKYPCPTIRALTAVYKDHPDYQQEWAL